MLLGASSTRRNTRSEPGLVVTWHVCERRAGSHQLGRGNHREILDSPVVAESVAVIEAWTPNIIILVATTTSSCASDC